MKTKRKAPKVRKRRTKEERKELQKKVATFLDNNPKAKNFEIAEALKITLPTVSAIRIHIGRTAKRTTDQMAALCKRYRKFRKNNPKAGTRLASEALGVTPALIVYIRRKLEIAPRRSPRTRDRLKKKIKEVLGQRPDLSNRELAYVIGRSKTTVVGIRRDLNLSRDTLNSRDILFISVGQQVRQLVIKEGTKMTDDQIAKKVGIALSTLTRWLGKLGIPTGKKRRYGPDEEFFWKMWSDGWSDVEISRVMGCVYQRVQKWRYRNELQANVIHDNLRTDALCRDHTPTTLLDVTGSPMGSKSLDRIWAFAALGANRAWLYERFPDVARKTISEVVNHLLSWPVPKNLRRIIRRRQLVQEK